MVRHFLFLHSSLYKRKKIFLFIIKLLVSRRNFSSNKKKFLFIIKLLVSRRNFCSNKTNLKKKRLEFPKIFLLTWSAKCALGSLNYNQNIFPYVINFFNAQLSRRYMIAILLCTTTHSQTRAKATLSILKICKQFVYNECSYNVPCNCCASR